MKIKNMNASHQANSVKSNFYFIGILAIKAKLFVVTYKQLGWELKLVSKEEPNLKYQVPKATTQFWFCLSVLKFRTNAEHPICLDMR